MDPIVLKMLEQVKSGELEIDQAQKLIAAQTAAKKPVTFKLSVKKAVSFYGIRRMPITLYIQELEAIIETYNSEEFQLFKAENDANFSRK